MDTSLGSLSMRGWIKDTATKADQLLVDAFTAEFEQSDLFYSDITSISHAYQQFATRPDAFGSYISDYLTRYLTKFFDNAEVTANVTFPEDSGTTYVTHITVTIYDNGQSKNIAYLFQSNKSKLQQYLRLTN